MRYFLFILLFICSLAACQTGIKSGTTADNGVISSGTTTDGAVFTDVEEVVSSEYGTYASDFISAAGLTGTDSSAIVYLVEALVDSSLIDSMYAIYPIVGGVDTAHRYNLLSPYNADTSYRLTFAGTITHDSSGMTSNGTNGYADTHFETTGTNAQNFHVSFFAADDVYDATLNYQMGVRDTGDGGNIHLSSTAIISGEQSHYSRMGGGSVYYPASETQGYYLSQASDTATFVYRDGVKTMMSTIDGDTVTGQSMYLLATRKQNGSFDDPTGQTCIFSTIGKSLTDYQVYQLSHIARTYNGMLDRYVDSTYTGYPAGEYPLTLVDNGAFSPAVTQDADLQEWEALSQHTFMICWNTRGYTPVKDLAFGGYALSPYIIDTDSMYMSETLDSIDALGAELVYFTLFEAHGFSLEPIPDSIGQPERLVEKFNGHVKFDAELNPRLDNDIVEKFVDGCVARGIEPAFYINPMKNLNLQPNTGWGYQSWDSTDAKHYSNWLASYTQFLLTEYDTVDYLWVDGWTTDSTADNYPVIDFQGLYDAVKSVDTSIMVVMNHFGDTEFERYPYDIGSTEQYVLDSILQTGDGVLSDTVKSNGGTDYRIPAEFIVNVAGDPNETFWYATSDTGTTLRPISELQDAVDRAFAVDAKICVAVIPGRNGRVDEAQWDTLRGIDFTYPVEEEGSSYSAEYQDVLDAMAADPSATNAAHQDTLMMTLRDSVGLDSIVSFYFFAQEYNTGDEALVDWINTDSSATNVGSLVHTTLQGFTGADNKYIDLNFKPSGETSIASQNSVSFGVFTRSLNFGDITHGAFSTVAPAGRIQIVESGTTMYHAANSSTQSSIATTELTVGLNAVVRRSSSVQIFHQNGTETGAAVASLPPINLSVWVLGRNVNGSVAGEDQDQVAAAFIANGLSEAKLEVIERAIEKCLDGQGTGAL